MFDFEMEINRVIKFNKDSQDLQLKWVWLEKFLEKKNRNGTFKI